MDVPEESTAAPGEDRYQVNDKATIKRLDEELAFPGLHDTVLRIFHGFSRGLVFDGASGNGVLSRRLADLGHTVISTDIEIKPNLQPGLRFFQSDLNRDIPVKSGRFDYCVSLETIEHLENPWHFVRQLARLLKPGGRLILSTPNINYLTCKICYALKGSFYPFFGEWQYDVIGHITPLSRYYLERILRKCGFRVEKVTYNRYRIPHLKIPSPIRMGLFGESLIVVAVKHANSPG